MCMVLRCVSIHNFCAYLCGVYNCLGMYLKFYVYIYAQFGYVCATYMYIYIYMLYVECSVSVPSGHLGLGSRAALLSRATAVTAGRGVP